MPDTLQWVAVCVPGAGTSQIKAGALAVSCVAPDGTTGHVEHVRAYLQLEPSPFTMTAEDGAVLSTLIISCWAAAYVFKAVINVVRGSSE